MTLPPPPESFFDGGAPKSEVAPGDTGRELLHDVKNLIQAVNLLRGVVQRQKRRQRQIIVVALLALAALIGAIGYSRYLYVVQTQDRIDANRQACERANDRGDALAEMLTAAYKASPKSPQATAFFEPRIKRINDLREDCDARYPHRGGKGWPSFWSA